MWVENKTVPTNPQVFDRSAHANCVAASVTGMNWVEDVFILFFFLLLYMFINTFKRYVIKKKMCKLMYLGINPLNVRIKLLQLTRRSRAAI